MKFEKCSKALMPGLLFLFAEYSFATATCPLNLPGATFMADYTSSLDRQKYLTLVESAHFTPPVQSLIRGQSGLRIGPDLSYTLDHFPNHHLALDSLSRFVIREKIPRPIGVRCTAEGFFERAIEFKPDDAMVHMLYGMHFSRLNKNDKAIKQFEEAEKLDPNNTNLLYNLGIVYFDLKQYDKAMGYADKAYRDKFPLDGLKNKLKKVGKWVEPKIEPPPSEDKPSEAIKPVEDAQKKEE